MFKEIVELLSEYPFLGRQVKSREERVFVKDHYQIFYLNDKKQIRILHLWDSRRDPDELKL